MVNILHLSKDNRADEKFTGGEKPVDYETKQITEFCAELIRRST